jgi:MinD-like ATPase involved in chromosome partitioning or flagellar assembly
MRPPVFAISGAVGGAGTTTLSVLLAAALAHTEHKVLLLDAAPAGGDLLIRAFGRARVSSPHWQMWVRDGAVPAVLNGLLVPDVQQLVILSGAAPLSAGSADGYQDSYDVLRVAIASAVASGWTVVLDAGSGAGASPLLAAAIDEDAALAVVIPQRPDGANRSRWYLSGLAGRYGRETVKAAVVAIVDQDAQHPHVRRAVADGLKTKTSAVVQIPADPQLATGLVINPPAIAPVTVAAVSAVAAALLKTREPAPTAIPR